MIFFDGLLFFISFIILWFSAKMVIEAVKHFSKSIRVSSFVTSFLILGILTSISEMSVGVNSLINHRPEVYVGNLIGASFVILLFIIPVLAIFNRGINLKQKLDTPRLILFLALIFSPSVITLDGRISRFDALIIFCLYGVFLYFFQKQENVWEHISSLGVKQKPDFKNVAKIFIGAALIFIAGNLLVDKTVYFADLIHIPSFIISLMMISIGTNLPELVIAFNSLRHKNSDVAFGDYVGSAATNPLLFAIFTIINGSFSIANQGFNLTFFIILFGYILFFLFARSKSTISPKEGLALFLVYLIFLSAQAIEILVFSPNI